MNLLLNTLLIPLWDMLGAAVATAISTATWNLLMLRFVQTELSTRCSAFHLAGKQA